MLIDYDDGDDSNEKVRAPSLEEEEEDRRFEDLRYVTFGASRTWGAGLRDKRLEQAYPWLLSKNATNLAIRATGPEYPSLCVYSMVGDDAVYDVIILEFYMNAFHLLRLAKRLRQRFPDAIIIFLRIWGPMQINFKKTNKNFREWMISSLDKNATGNPKIIYKKHFHKYLLKNTNPEDWMFNPHTNSVEKQNEAAQAVGGYIIEARWPGSDPRMDFIHNAHLFATDLTHWSAAGHRMVAKLIRDALQDIVTTTQREDGQGVGIERSSSQLLRRDHVEPWADKDVCVSWYETGIIQSTAVEHSPDIVMNRFSTDHSLQKFNLRNGKYALEVFQDKVNWLRLRNSMQVPANVHMRFMAMGPPPANKYPQTVFRTTFSSDNFQKTLVNPGVDDYDHNVHVNRVQKVATIPSHRVSSISIIPQGPKKEYPFRITGVIIAPEEQDEEGESFQTSTTSYW